MTSRGSGTHTNIYGLDFEKDEDGDLIITWEIVVGTLKSTFNKKLKSQDRWSGPNHVKAVMATLDTVFYDISQDSAYSTKKFVYPPNPITFTAEQVNYMGVGLGFDHFHIFGHSSTIGQAMVLAWNVAKYVHLSSFGEHYWAGLGFELYGYTKKEA